MVSADFEAVQISTVWRLTNEVMFYTASSSPQRPRAPPAPQSGTATPNVKHELKRLNRLKCTNNKYKLRHIKRLKCTNDTYELNGSNTKLKFRMLSETVIPVFVFLDAVMPASFTVRFCP